MERTQYRYRIREFDGNFYVEAEVKEKTGILWWRKTKTTWRDVDTNGVPCFFVSFGGYSIDTWKIKLPPFNSLKEAEEQVEKFVWPELFTKIHEVRNRSTLRMPDPLPTCPFSDGGSIGKNTGGIYT